VEASPGVKDHTKLQAFARLYEARVKSRFAVEVSRTEIGSERSEFRNRERVRDKGKVQNPLRRY